METEIKRIREESMVTQKRTKHTNSHAQNTHTHTHAKNTHTQIFICLFISGLCDMNDLRRSADLRTLLKTTLILLFTMVQTCQSENL